MVSIDFHEYDELQAQWSDAILSFNNDKTKVNIFIFKNKIKS